MRLYIAIDSQPTQDAMSFGDMQAKISGGSTLNYRHQPEESVRLHIAEQEDQHQVSQLSKARVRPFPIIVRIEHLLYVEALQILSPIQTFCHTQKNVITVFLV